MGELVTALGRVSSDVQCYATLPFLRSSPVLLPDEVRAELTEAHVESIAANSEAGPETLLHLMALDLAGRRSDSIAELTQAVRAELAQFLDHKRTERVMLTAHLTGPKCDLFAGKRVHATEHDLTELLTASGGSGALCMQLLIELDTHVCLFPDLPSLIAAVRRRADDHGRELGTMLQRVHRDARALFESRATALDVDKDDAQRMLEQCGFDVGSLTQHLNSLSAEKPRFGDVRQLLG